MTVSNVPSTSASFIVPPNGRGLISVPLYNSDGSVTTSPNFTTQATMREHHHDRVEIIKHPIQIGAPITDHTYVLPAELTLDVIYEPQGTTQPVTTYLNYIYDQLLAAKSNRILFTVYTTKRTYTQMLIESLTTETDNTKQNILEITIALQQILLVSTTFVSGVSAIAANQALPQDTNPPQTVGIQQAIPVNSNL